MLFNSYEFIFFFLPVTFIIYFVLNHAGRFMGAKAWLVLASLFFYSWWNIKYLPLILVSMGINYLAGWLLTRDEPFLSLNRRWILIAGIVFNLILLGYYKYTDFFLANLNTLFSGHLPLIQVILPLGISFFTFTQIAYLVDAYRREAREYQPVNYALFVTFFPHLLAGPILHHREMMPQFEREDNKSLDYTRIAPGLLLLAIGLFKKVIIADSLAKYAALGFDQVPVLSCLEAWITSLSYTLQLYFDFSGYTDIAIGTALMFNIVLPVNFYSPYKSLNIQEFWRRWHMTLGRFFRDYVYIPLGGNRRGTGRTYLNLFITFALVGLWHGAGWTFVFWGALHGVALMTHRVWRKRKCKMNTVLAWFLTFNFVNIGWVFFRARTWTDALKVLSGMIGLNGITLPQSLAHYGFLSSMGIRFGTLFPGGDLMKVIIMLAICLVISLTAKNSMQMRDDFQPGYIMAVFAAAIGVLAIINLTHVSEFLYFNF